MRLDLFLKRTYLVKYRQTVCNLCKEGAILINGLPGNIGDEICVGDELLISLFNQTFRAQVLCLPTNSAAKGHQWSYIDIIEEKLDIAYSTMNPQVFGQKLSTNH